MDLLASSILNVDDYQPSLYARSRVLRQAGFSVLEATNGAQTLRLVSEMRPPIVLLDVNLPDMSGFEVCQRIRSTPEIAGTAILHISASNVQSRFQVQGLEGGADSYLVEPIDPPVLIATVRAFLRARRAEDALRRSNEELARFAYTVAHELSEPLRNISVHSQLLEHCLCEQLNDATKESFHFVVQSAQKMRSFIDDILRFSDATHPSGVEPVEIDSEALVTETLFNLDALIQSTGARISHTPLPLIKAGRRFEYVFQNLIGNAIKYRRPGVAPEIHISARPHQEFWIFSVQDNGIGIEPRYQQGIFQLFRRLHGRDVPGHGIGLALVQRIVEANGGKIWLQSEPGAGSTFYFSVHAAEAAMQKKSNHASS